MCCQLISSCHQAASQSEPRIIEQSRRERPDWVHSPLTHPTKSGESIEYHMVKTKVMDLPLGLRQAEASALNDTKLMVENEILLFWKKNEVFQSLEASDRALVQQQLEKLLDARITAKLIGDIYFEKILDPTSVMALQETYSIHTRIVMKPSEMPALMHELRNFCQNSLSQGLIKLAKVDQVFSTQP